MRYKKLEWNEGEQIGDKYYGRLKHELLDGEGVYIWGNGRKYIGSYKNGVKQGKGTFFWPEYGDQYTGEWLNDQFHGRTPISQDMEIGIFGDWYKGKQQGMGSYTYEYGDQYTGEWLNDRSMDGAPISGQTELSMLEVGTMAKRMVWASVQLCWEYN